MFLWTGTPIFRLNRRNVDSSIGAVVLYRQVRVYKNVQAVNNLHLNETLPYDNYKRCHNRYVAYPPKTNKQKMWIWWQIHEVYFLFFFNSWFPVICNQNQQITHKIAQFQVHIPWSKISQKLSLIYYRPYRQVALEVSLSVLAKLRSYTNIEQFRM